jgi:hypothetical protein
MRQAFSIAIGGRPEAAYARLRIKNADSKSVERRIVEKGLGRDKVGRPGASDVFARVAARVKTG